MIIKDKELNDIVGGVNWSILAGLSVIVTMIVGIIDGYVRPLKCN